jgi:hypothetical protein
VTAAATPYEPYTSPGPRYVELRTPGDAAVLHAARRVRWRRLKEAGVPVWARLLAAWQRLRLWAALVRTSGSWRYRVRLVRWLRADVGLVERAPLRALVDHRRRVVYFDYDRYARRRELVRDPAVLDEARHIRERLGLPRRRRLRCRRRHRRG